MKWVRDRVVKQMMAQTRAYVNTMDTEVEVRYNVGYRFIVDMSDALMTNGVPNQLACLAAARLNVKLPDRFDVQYPAQYNDLISLWAFSISVTYRALIGDYDDTVVPEMFLSMCSRISINLEY